MDKLAAAIGQLFKRIAEFFDIFDLSFFVSGGLCLSAIGTWVNIKNPDGWKKLTALVGHPVGGVLLVLSIYVAGLIAFAWGRAFRVVIFDTLRWLRMRLSSKLPSVKHASQIDGPRASGHAKSEFEAILHSHGLSGEAVIADYLARGANEVQTVWRLYVRMWAKLRETPSLSSSFNLVKRYWVMAAVYDGLAFTAVVWFGALFFIVGVPHPLIFVGLFVAMAGCYRESQRLSNFQIEEMVASLALLDPKERFIWIPPLQGAAAQAELGINDEEVLSGELLREVPKKLGEEVKAPSKLPSDISM